MTETTRPAGAFPQQQPSNFFRQDPVLQVLLARVIPTVTRSWAVLQLELMGGNAAMVGDRLAREASRHPPTHRPYDAFGHLVEEVDYHPAWRELEQMGFGCGIVALKDEPELSGAHGHSRNVLGLSLAYLLGQSAVGLVQAVSHSDAAYRLIARFGTAAQRGRLLHRLASRDITRLCGAGVALAEKQGGPNGPGTTTLAIEEDGRFRLHGEKWFCSNVGAQLLLVSARPQSGGDVRLFLVERGAPGVLPSCRINRLKDKLGMRSLATAEITLSGTPAEPLGAPEQAGEVLAELALLSRLYTAFNGAAVMRRSIFEATQFLRMRASQGRDLLGQPLIREALADLNAMEMAAKHLAFWAARHLDDADAGDREARRLAEVVIPLAKFLSAQGARWATGEALELHGGNGFVEDFVIARLLRDAQALPVLDGTTNLLSLELLEACARDRIHEPLFAEARRRCLAAPEQERRQVLAFVERVEQELERSAANFAREPAKPLVERLALVYPLALLAEEAGTPSESAPLCLAAVRRLLQRQGDASAAPGAEELALLAGGTVQQDRTAVP